MENKEQIKSLEEMTSEELDAVSGGVYITTYEKEPNLWLQNDSYLARLYKRVSPPKYPCPKCSSKEVGNYDPGPLFQMRVFCKACGFYGCRDGSDAR